MSRVPRRRVRAPGVGAVGLGMAAAVLTACTGGVGPSGTPGADAEVTVPNQVPDATVAVTDGPRPETTDVVLTFAEWNASTAGVEAAGYVSPVVETGGTCELELERDGRRIVVTAPAEADATTTACGGLRAPAAELGPGEWTAVLRYSSDTTEGSSQPVTVEVPR